MTTTAAKSLMVLSLLVSAYGLGADAVPAELQKYAQSMKGDVTELVTSDPTLMKEIGAKSPQEVAKLKLDFSQAFQMSKVEAGKLEGAKSLASAVVGTGTYYVPLCGDKGCPIMAAFALEGAGREPVFQSVGQPNLLSQIRETQERVAKDPAYSGGTTVVDYPEGHVGFVMARKAGSGEEVLVPQSEAEGKVMLASLDRPASDTDGAGRPRLSLADMRQIAKATRERAESAPNMPETGLSDPSDFHWDKPANDAPGSAARTVDANGVVLAIDTPKPEGATDVGATAATAQPGQPVTDVAQNSETGAAPAPAVVREEATESSSPINLPVALGIGGAVAGLLAAWALRRSR